MEQVDRLAQRLVAAHPLLLDLGQPFLIALQRRLDRLEQGLELRLALLAGLVEAGVGPFEELLLRLAEQFRADLVELGGERLLGLHQLLHPRLEIAGVGLEGGEFPHRGVALGGRSGQIGAELLGRFATLFGDRAGAAVAQHPAKRDAAGDEGGDDEEGDGVHLCAFRGERKANLQRLSESLKHVRRLASLRPGCSVSPTIARPEREPVAMAHRSRQRYPTSDRVPAAATRDMR